MDDINDIFEDSLEIAQTAPNEEIKAQLNAFPVQKHNYQQKDSNQKQNSNTKLLPDIFDWDESVETIQFVTTSKPPLNKLPPRQPPKNQLPNDSSLNQRELLEIQQMQKNLLSKRFQSTKITATQLVPLRLSEIENKAQSSKSQYHSQHTFFKEFTQNVAEINSEATPQSQNKHEIQIPLPSKLPSLKEEQAKRVQYQLVNQWRPISAQEMQTRPISSIRRKVSKSRIAIKPPSNKQRIKNAIAKVCLAGQVNLKERSIVLENIALSQTDNFIIVLKNSDKLEFKAIYAYQNGRVTKLYSSCSNLPDEIQSSLVTKYFRYDTVNNGFKEIIANTMFSYSVDAITLLQSITKKIM